MLIYNYIRAHFYEWSANRVVSLSLVTCQNGLLFLRF